MSRDLTLKDLGECIGSTPGHNLPVEAVLASVFHTKGHRAPVYVVRDDGRVLGRTYDKTTSIARVTKAYATVDGFNVTSWMFSARYLDPKRSYRTDSSGFTHYRTKEVEIYQKGIVVVTTGDLALGVRATSSVEVEAGIHHLVTLGMKDVQSETIFRGPRYVGQKASHP